MTPQEFFDAYGAHAVRSGVKWGIPPSLTLAQAALESGWGRHATGFNFFGIKGRGPAGTRELKTTEVIDGDTVNMMAGFRMYNNAEEAFDDHNRLLSESHFYERARESSPDSVAMAHTLTGVYATDPDYGDKLESIIRKYRLRQKFDAAVIESKRRRRKKRRGWRVVLDALLDALRGTVDDYMGRRRNGKARMEDD